MKRFILLNLFLLILAVVPTAAYAIDATITVNGNPAVTFLPAATPGAGDPLILPDGTTCSQAPCSVNIRTYITDGIYCTAVNDCLNVIGAYAEATVQTNATTIGASTSISNVTNISGTFQYIGSTSPAEIQIVTNNRFALPSGVWTTVGKGGFKCKNFGTSTSPLYNPASCTLSSSTVQSGTCTLCRAFGYTDEGYLTRPDPTDPSSNLPANGDMVTMTSSAIFEDTAGNQKHTEKVGGSLTYTVPDFSVNVEDGHFYLGSTQQENIACEPLKTDVGSLAFTCGNFETKTATLDITNVQPNDQIFLPATSTTVTASDPAVLQIYLQADMPIDVQPLDEVFDPSLYGGLGGWKGGVNNDFNVNSNGNWQVAVFSTPNVDACAIQPYDLTDPLNPVPLVFLSVAGSDFRPFINALGPVLDSTNTCIGQDFQFSIPDIAATIPGSTTAEKQIACQKNPVATMLLANVTQVSGYSVNTTTKGGKKSTYTVLPNCTKDKQGNVTCTVSGTVGGAQIINCSTPAGG